MQNQSSENPLSPKRFFTKENAQLEIYGRLGKIYCRMTNLSQTGAFLEIVNAKYTPKPGELLRMTILLRQVNKTHTIDAEIVWSKGLGLGINFIKKDQLFEKLSARPPNFSAA